jgi:hypothetical protein
MENDYGRYEEEQDFNGKESEEGRGTGKIRFLNSRGGFRRSHEKVHHHCCQPVHPDD